MALYAATGLPIIVAVMTIAVSSGIVDEETSSIFVAGGALTVAIFPLLSSLVKGKEENEQSKAKAAESKKEEEDSEAALDDAIDDAKQEAREGAEQEGAEKE